MITTEAIEFSTPSSAFTLEWLISPSGFNSHTAAAEAGALISLSFILITVYALGVMYRSLVFGINLSKIRKLILCSNKRREESYWLINLSHNKSTFSFLNYIFISSQALTSKEYQQVLQHELLHVRQRHTMDLLLLELTHSLLWFHPLIPYLKKQLRQVHEYLADQAVVRESEEQKGYAQLLLKLASENHALTLATSFSSKQVGQRIAMLTKPRSHPNRRWRFSLIVPLCASIFLLSACLEDPSTSEDATSSGQFVRKVNGSQIIGKVHWEGNTIYSDEFLSEKLGLQSGDVYDSVAINQQLSYNPEGDDVSSFYMDQGYLFFRVDVQKTEAESGKVNLTFSIYEGEPIVVNEIRIQGNEDISKEAILKKISIEPGEPFN